MIPSIVARQTRETLLDYLRTTFDFSDAGFSKTFYEFLDSPEGLFRGPYVDVRLPFRNVSPVPPALSRFDHSSIRIGISTAPFSCYGRRTGASGATTKPTPCATSCSTSCTPTTAPRAATSPA